MAADRSGPDRRSGSERRRGRPRLPLDLELIARMKADGKTHEEIAQLLGVDRRTIDRRFPTRHRPARELAVLLPALAPDCSTCFVCGAPTGGRCGCQGPQFRPSPPAA